MGCDAATVVTTGVEEHGTGIVVSTVTGRTTAW